MIEDINEPLDLYRTRFKDEHARHTAELFESLRQAAGVDEAENAETVRVLRGLEAELAAAQRSSGWWKFVRVVAWVAGGISLLLAFTQPGTWWLVGGLAGAALAGFLIFSKLNALVADLAAQQAELQMRVADQKAAAWAQMAPLNGLYRWEFLAKLFRKTVPRIEFDPYFSDGRLDELRRSFGWTDEFNQDRSILFAHSGVLNGNPFVVARTLHHWMGEKTYHGTKQISWTERVQNSQGKWTTVRRTQTLHASVTKPFPEYSDQPAIVFGSEAAPDLTFSRTPSKLSGLEDGVFNNWRKNRAIKKLERKARDLDDGKGFTVMANAELDALFGATDRDHEVQFRLLFTPLAQQEMLKLLKDKEVGFGDDFHFYKQQCVNLVAPEHLAGVDISGDPANFHHYELAHARAYFNEYYNTLFRHLYFGIAPLLAIPIYQQHRSHADIYKDVYTRRSNFWEHEAIANHFGEAEFQHPDCVTRSLLKTEASLERDGAQSVRVSAHGYRGIDRVDYVGVYGGDGRLHQVPVPWVEYIEVSRSSRVVVQELPPESAAGEGDSQAGAAASTTANAAWVGIFRTRGLDPASAVLRRSIVASLVG